MIKIGYWDQYDILTDCFFHLCMGLLMGEEVSVARGFLRKAER